MKAHQCNINKCLKRAEAGFWLCDFHNKIWYDYISGTITKEDIPKLKERYKYDELPNY